MNDFVFLANWYDVIKAYDDAGQSDIANAIAKEIIIYGVTGDTRTTDPLIYGIVRGMCTAQIKKVKARNPGSAKGGRPKVYKTEDIIDLSNNGLSLQDIADNLGCSVKTVQRALANADSDDEI